MGTRTAKHARLAAGTLILVLATACGGDSTVAAPPPPAPPVVATETPEPVDPAHAAAIEEYWQARQEAWNAGLGSGVAFVVSHLHPQLAYSAEDCVGAWFGAQPPAGFVERSTFEPDSLRRDEGWTMPTGPLQDVDLDGDVYLMNVSFDYVGAPAYWAPRRTEAHLEVVDGRVRNFLRCEIPTVTISAPENAVATSPDAPAPASVPVPVDAPATPVPAAPADMIGEPVVLPAPAPPTYPGAPAPQPAPRTPTVPVPPPPPPAPAPAPAPEAPPEDEGSREPGSGLDFCLGDGSGPPAGDYRICPDDDPQ